MRRRQPSSRKRYRDGVEELFGECDSVEELEQSALVSDFFYALLLPFPSAPLVGLESSSRLSPKEDQKRLLAGAEALRCSGGGDRASPDLAGDGLRIAAWLVGRRIYNIPPSRTEARRPSHR
nr:unnamed protein product [Digitaria exilis]